MFCCCHMSINHNVLVTDFVFCPQTPGVSPLITSMGVIQITEMFCEVMNMLFWSSSGVHEVVMAHLQWLPSTLNSVGFLLVTWNLHVNMQKSSKMFPFLCFVQLIGTIGDCGVGASTDDCSKDKSGAQALEAEGRFQYLELTGCFNWLACTCCQEIYAIRKSCRLGNLLGRPHFCAVQFCPAPRASAQWACSPVAPTQHSTQGCSPPHRGCRDLHAFPCLLL